MNKKIIYSFIPAIAAIGVFVGFKSSDNTTNTNNCKDVNVTSNVSNCHCNDDHGEHKDWTKIDDSYLSSVGSLTLGAGSYYLGNDINFNDNKYSTWNNRGFTINGKVDFCLNGHFIKGSSAASGSNANTNIFSINDNCELNLYDCNGEQKEHYFVPLDEVNPDDNYWMPSDEKTEWTITMDGGYLFCDGCLAVGCKGTFNMNGGTIVGRSHGVNLETEYGQQKTIISTPNSCDNATINIKNGNICGCNAKSSIISVGTDANNKSSINITGGEIRDSYGSGAIISNRCEVNITGGKIHNCYTGLQLIGNAIVNNDTGSKTKIAGNAEITDNISLLIPSQICGCVTTNSPSTIIELGGTAKVVRNRGSTDIDLGHSYSERIKTTVLANIVCYQNSSTLSVLEPITDEPDSLKLGARFGVRAKTIELANADDEEEYTFTDTLDKSCKQYFFADNPDFWVKEIENNKLMLSKIKDEEAYKPDDNINVDISETPKEKPTINNAILLSGKLHKSVEVVIKDKEDLGKIKEKVEENIKKDLTPNSHLISQFDIRLESEGVVIENIDGNKYGVTLKLPDTYSALSQQKVIYIKDDGSIEMKDTIVTGNECYFETTHFSTWGFAAEGKLVPGGGGGSKASAGSVAGIVIGSVAGSGTVFFVIYIILFKKKLRFFINGYKVYEERLKWKEDIDFNNKNIAGMKWYSDKKLTKPFTNTKMGLFNKSLYTHSDEMYGGNIDNSNNVDVNINTPEQNNNTEIKQD